MVNPVTPVVDSSPCCTEPLSHSLHRGGHSSVPHLLGLFGFMTPRMQSGSGVNSSLPLPHHLPNLGYERWPLKQKSKGTLTLKKLLTVWRWMTQSCIRVSFRRPLGKRAVRVRGQKCCAHLTEGWGCRAYISVRGAAIVVCVGTGCLRLIYEAMSMRRGFSRGSVLSHVDLCN